MDWFISPSWIHIYIYEITFSRPSYLYSPISSHIWYITIIPNIHKKFEKFQSVFFYKFENIFFDFNNNNRPNPKFIIIRSVQFAENIAKSSSDGMQMTIFKILRQKVLGANFTNSRILHPSVTPVLFSLRENWYLVHVFNFPLGIQSISQLKTVSEELERYSNIAIFQGDSKKSHLKSTKKKGTQN